MGTPHNWPTSSEALSSGPSQHILQQLLEEISNASSNRTVRKAVSLQSLTDIQTRHSPSGASSVWVGGSSLAREARHKLRAADEARWRKNLDNTVDGSSEPLPSTLRLDTSEVGSQDTKVEHCMTEDGTHHQQSPDPVGDPHDHLHYVLQNSPLSETAALSPVARSHDNIPSHSQTSQFGIAATQPLSPLIFSDVSYDDVSSPLPTQTRSPTEEMSSATTVGTTERLQSPVVDSTSQSTGKLPRSSMQLTTA